MFGNIIAVLSWHVDVCDYQISACCESLWATLEGKAGGISIHPLYGDLPFEEQERAILPSAKRKIVLATNIAETSLTIEAVKVVIDSGLTRRLQHDPATGMNRLVTVAVSNAAAEQRKGWAGRLGPGICYRIYSRHAFQGMIPFTPPEMLLADLSPLILELAVWGVKDPTELSWLDDPWRAVPTRQAKPRHRHKVDIRQQVRGLSEQPPLFRLFCSALFSSALLVGDGCHHSGNEVIHVPCGADRGRAKPHDDQLLGRNDHHVLLLVSPGRESVPRCIGPNPVLAPVSTRP